MSYVVAMAGVVLMVSLSGLTNATQEWWYGLGLLLLVLYGVVRYTFRVVVRWSEVWIGLIIGCVIAARFGQMAIPQTFKVDNFTNKAVRLSGVVVSQPHQTIKSLQVTLDQIVIVDRYESWYGSVQVTMPVHSQINYGDKLILEGSIKDLSQVEAGYRQYLENQNVTGMMVWPKILDRLSGQGNSLISWGISSQEYMAGVTQRLLPQDLSAFLLGVVLGSDQMLSEEFDMALQTTGTSHIVVASGYNIGILIAFCVMAVSRFGRLVQISLSMVVVIGFVLVSGLDASLIRASVMAGLAMVALLLGRQRQALHLLFVAGLAMLVINPRWIIDIGFQLSFMATLSLILFQPSIDRILPSFLPIWLKEILSSTTAAQVLVYPILMLSFSTLSLVSLLTNVMVLWLIPWLMLGGVVVLILGWLDKNMGQVAAYVLYPWLWYVREVIVLTSRMPMASIGVKLDWLGVALYYALVMLLHGFVRQRRQYEQSA